jgi:hypothetical protein
VVLLRHLGKELSIPVPEVASLRALYSRGRTLSDHQELACRWLRFSWMTAHQRGALVRPLRDEVAGCADREQLLAHARRWLYEHRLLIVHDRALRALVTTASRELEADVAATIRRTVGPAQGMSTQLMRGPMRQLAREPHTTSQVGFLHHTRPWTAPFALAAFQISIESQ